MPALTRATRSSLTGGSGTPRRLISEAPRPHASSIATPARFGHSFSKLALTSQQNVQRRSQESPAALSIQRSGLSNALRRPHVAISAIKPVLRQKSADTIQRVGVRVSALAPDVAEEDHVISRVLLTGRPPHGEYKRVKGLTEKDEHVGHETGWIVDQKGYEDMLVGQTIKQVATSLRSTGIQVTDNIESIEHGFGHWINRDYAKRYPINNFFPQNGTENTEEGGRSGYHYNALLTSRREGKKYEEVKDQVRSAWDATFQINPKREETDKKAKLKEQAYDFYTLTGYPPRTPEQQQLGLSLDDFTPDHEESRKRKREILPNASKDKNSDL